jgi:multiple inositol-polyphosphate phosphatase/2,3-bisphosphoglycerate 3-phosphatase
MKRLFTAIAACLAVGLYGQQCPVSLGSKTLYRPLQVQYTPVPKGFTPVFINHVNRHSARHITKDVQAGALFRTIRYADSAGLLTTEGKRLYTMLQRFGNLEHPHVKNISDTGRMELQAIARRMVQQYAGVFRQSAAVSVAYTKEVRTAQSADAFLEAFREATGNAYHLVQKVPNDTLLRFYDLSPAYVRYEKKGPWQKAYEALAARIGLDSISNAFAARIFRNGTKSEVNGLSARELALEVFGYGTIAASVYPEARRAGWQPADIDFLGFFSCREQQQLSLADGAEDYLAKAPALNNNGVQTLIAAPLLNNFLNTTDSFITSGKVQAQLRFAHAETIAPFAALLQLQGSSEVCADLARLPRCWDAASVIPLSANIQWILYRGPGNRYLVKVLLNEKETAINGLPAKQFPYYDWAMVRAFYRKLLQQAGFSKAASAYAFLQALGEGKE